MAVDVLRTLLTAPGIPSGYPSPAQWGQASGVVEAWESYCRPTCGAEGDKNYDECEEGADTCGCPCGHGEG